MTEDGGGEGLQCGWGVRYCCSWLKDGCMMLFMMLFMLVECSSGGVLRDGSGVEVLMLDQACLNSALPSGGRGPCPPWNFVA